MLTQVTRQEVEPQEVERNKLKVNLTVTMPVFFYSDNFKEADTMNLVTKVDRQLKQLSFTNNDNQHIYVKTINVDNKEYKYNWYVLPGNTISIPFTGNKENEPVKIVTDRMTIVK